MVAVNLFNRLNERLEVGKSEGISPLDIGDLPRPHQRIMFLLLRDQRGALDGMTLETLTTRLENLPELPQALSDLSKNGWLITLGEVPNLRYKINLRRRRGASINGVWTQLIDRMSDQPVKPWSFEFKDLSETGGMPELPPLG
jgi:hypothetical protein